MRDKLARVPLFSAALLVFLLSLGIILAALGFEHIGGYKPCPLCLMERKAWYMAMPTALLALLLYKIQRPVLVKLLLALIALMFVVNAGLAGYHAGIEWKWWAGPSSCTGDHLETLGGPGGLLEAIKKTKVVRCDIAQFRLFGLSFSGYNVLASLFAALIAALGLVFSRQNND